MKLDELKTEPIGTYVGLRVHPASAAQILEHCVNAGIPVDRSKFERQLHTTVIYSRKHLPNLEVLPSRKHIAEFKDYSIFGEHDGERILVALIYAPSIEARHLQLMSLHNATYDFPVYLPHISLCYNYTGEITDLPPMKFEIILGDEYTEDLSLDAK